MNTTPTTIFAADRRVGDHFFVPNNRGGFFGPSILIITSDVEAIVASTANGGRRSFRPTEVVEVVRF
jgi:hypothetical protein